MENTGVVAVPMDEQAVSFRLGKFEQSMGTLQGGLTAFMEATNGAVAAGRNDYASLSDQIKVLTEKVDAIAFALTKADRGPDLGALLAEVKASVDGVVSAQENRGSTTAQALQAATDRMNALAETVGQHMGQVRTDMATGFQTAQEANTSVLQGTANKVDTLVSRLDALEAKLAENANVAENRTVRRPRE